MYVANSPAEADRDGSANHQQSKNVFLLQGGCSAAMRALERAGAQGSLVGRLGMAGKLILG